MAKRATKYPDASASMSKASANKLVDFAKCHPVMPMKNIIILATKAMVMRCRSESSAVRVFGFLCSNVEVCFWLITDLREESDFDKIRHCMYD